MVLTYINWNLGPAGRNPGKHLRRLSQPLVCIEFSNPRCSLIKSRRAYVFYRTNIVCVGTRSFFLFVFSPNSTEKGDLLSKSPSSVPMWKNINPKKIRIWTIFAQSCPTPSWNIILYFLLKDTALKSVWIRSFSGPYFPSFGLNTEKYGVSLRIQSECGKIRTRKTPNTDTFHAVRVDETFTA